MLFSKNFFHSLSDVRVMRRPHGWLVLALFLSLSCGKGNAPAGGPGGPGIGTREATVTTEETLYSEDHLDFKKWNLDPAKCCEAKGKSIAIASGGPLSSAIGLKVAGAGGNIVDVAVAVAFALNVERVQSTGLGGGGFMLVHLAKQIDADTFVDFRETAPRNAKAELFLDAKKKPIARATLDGAKAVATPGMVAGLFDAHKRWGKLPWADLIKPAIELAKKGFPINPSLAEKIEARKALLAADPYTKKLLFDDKGLPKKVNTPLVQEDLAKTLQQIALKGKEVFYTGELAKEIAKAVKARGGVLDEADLKAYKVQFRKPVKGTFKEYTLISAPPPSAGGVMLVEVLNILDGFDLKKEAMASPSVYVHTLAEAMKRGYADRSELVGDPDTLPPAKATAYAPLLTPEYAKVAHGKISLAKAIPAKDIKPGELLKEKRGGTTHLSIIDNQGNAVSATITLNTGNFGSGVAVPGTGIFLNNEMDDFTLLPGEPNAYGLVSSDINAIQPNRRPVSSMSPTIVLLKGAPVLALGAAGGSKIISAVLEVMLNQFLVYEGNLRKSVLAPRAHHQWAPDALELEKGFKDTTRKKLEGLGHKLTAPAWTADVEAVFRDKTDGLTAVFDPRNLGGAAAK